MENRHIATGKVYYDTGELYFEGSYYDDAWNNLKPWQPLVLINGTTYYRNGNKCAEGYFQWGGLLMGKTYYESGALKFDGIFNDKHGLIDKTNDAELVAVPICMRLRLQGKSFQQFPQPDKGEVCHFGRKDEDFERILKLSDEIQGKTKMVSQLVIRCLSRMVARGLIVQRFLRIVVDNVETREDNPCVDGYTGFLFINSQGKTYTTSSINHILHAALLKYQKNVNPEFRNFAFHTMRHMFCTRLNASRMNPKNIQYIVGHASVDITMNTYTHASSDAAIAEFNEIFEKS